MAERGYGGGQPMSDTRTNDFKREKFKMKDFIGLINIAHPKYFMLVAGVLVGVLGTIIQLFVPKVAQSLINNFSSGIDYVMLAKVVGLFVLSAILSVVSGTMLGIFGEYVVQNLRKRIWNKMVRLKVKYFDEVKAGEMASRLVSDSSQVKELLAGTFPKTLSSILLILGSVIMMFKMDWQMTVAMVVVVPIATILIAPIMVFGQRIAHSRQDALASFNGNITESLGAIRLVKSSNAEKQASEQADEEIDKLYKIGLKEAIFDSSMQPIMMMLMMGMIFGLLTFGIHRVATGAMTMGTLMSFLMYMFNLIGAVPMVAMLFSEIGKAAGSTARVRDLLNEDEEDFNHGKNMDLSGKVLKAENIDFAYEDDSPILTDVSFEAKPNQVIAFAGPSGGGKSTIFSLLERFYEPTSGAIKFDETNIDDIKLDDYREQIGFVSQDSAILAGTIRDNLTYGLDRKVSDDELWDVLDLAFAKTFVKEMDNQLDTQVGERGVKISGGQRQRLAIARAFLRNPKILMLDEATASLDSESEGMVQKALTNLMKGRTTLVIAHRLSTIVDANNIYFVDHGHITGSGSHSQLLANHELYQKYVSEQLI